MSLIQKNQKQNLNPKPTAPNQPKVSSKRKVYTWQAGTHHLTLGIQTHLMGVLNITPDSFSQDGFYKDGPLLESILEQAQSFVSAGATILDIGGESSRPGAQRISDQEEMDRVLPVLEELQKHLQIPLSIDTYKPKVAQSCLKAGASIINNIRGTQLDSDILDAVRESKAGLILMHMFGSPENMQESYTYSDCVEDISLALKEALDECQASNLSPDHIVIDPGIGFGKSVEHNLQLINQLDHFAHLQRPILIGPSRKSFIGHILNKDIHERLHGTIATVCAGIMRGAHIVRVHDVAAVSEAIKVTDAILNEGLI